MGRVVTTLPSQRESIHPFSISLLYLFLPPSESLASPRRSHASTLAMATCCPEGCALSSRSRSRRYSRMDDAMGWGASRALQAVSPPHLAPHSHMPHATCRTPHATCHMPHAVPHASRAPALDESSTRQEGRRRWRTSSLQTREWGRERGGRCWRLPPAAHPPRCGDGERRVRGDGERVWTSSSRFRRRAPQRACG